MCKITVRPTGTSVAAQQYAAQQMALQQMQLYQQQQQAAASASSSSSDAAIHHQNSFHQSTVVGKSTINLQHQNDVIESSSHTKDEMIREIVPAAPKQTNLREAIVFPSSTPPAPPPAPIEKRQIVPSTANNTNDASLRAILAMCMPNRPPVRLGTIIRESLLGQVRLGEYTLPNAEIIPIVIKEFNMTQVLSKTTKHGKQLYEDALAELQIHAYISKQKSPHSISLYGLYHDSADNKLSAYMEYAAKGELFSLLQQAHTDLPFDHAANYFVQLMKGVNHLHSINVVHRDLSLENVLLTSDNQVKICDFGLSTICPPNHSINDGLSIGKIKYMPPELFYKEEYDPRLCDIWSSGVILFILLTGVFPYELPSADDPRLVLVCTGQINQLLAHWKRSPVDAQVVDLFAHIFCPPDQRWTAQQILNHPFCQRYSNTNFASLTTSTTSVLSPRSTASTILHSDSSLSLSPASSSPSSPNTPLPLHFHDTSPDISTPLSSSASSSAHCNSDSDICEITGALSSMMDNSSMIINHPNNTEMMNTKHHQSHHHHQVSYQDHHPLFSVSPDTSITGKFDQQRYQEGHYRLNDHYYQRSLNHFEPNQMLFA